MHELAALAAALCWALTGLLSAAPAAAVGPFAFGLYRQVAVGLMLAAFLAATGGWGGVAPEHVPRLVLSGLIGIFLGDTILFAALVRLGPRRAGALFALNAPMAALLGLVVLGERLSWTGWCGVVLSAAGVALAVMGRPGRSGGHAFEHIRGPQWIGVSLGLLAALGQAVGALIAKPVMDAGADPAAASLLRVAVSAAALGLLMALPWRVVRPQGGLSLRHAGQIALSGFVGMAVGMSLLLFALSGGKVGVIATLSALSPVMILPVLWLATGARPSRTSILGALIAVAGIALVFAR